MQSTETECPEKVRAVDWTRLLCRPISRPDACGGLWNGTNVACLFDLHVGYNCYMFDLRRKLKVA